jgi:hypothetical protein
MMGTTVDSPHNTEIAAAATSVTAADVAPDRPRRALKLVMSLQPRDGENYWALLALGAEGCDPVFHSVDVDALTEVLALIPPLVAEAEARWQTQPRYPSARPSKSSKFAPTPTHPSAAASPDTSTPKSAESAPTEPRSGTKPTTGQLSLFG